MAGLRPHLEHGPETYLVSENLSGGVFVEPDPANPGRVRKTTSPGTGQNSTTVLGLAIGDAAAAPGMQSPTQDAWGRYTTGVLAPPNEVGVAYRGSWWIRNTTETAIPCGTRVYAGADGAMVTSGDGPIVGIVIEPGGIASGAEGRVRLRIR